MKSDLRGARTREIALAARARRALTRGRSLSRARAHRALLSSPSNTTKRARCERTRSATSTCTLPCVNRMQLSLHAYQIMVRLHGCGCHLFLPLAFVQQFLA